MVISLATNTLDAVRGCLEEKAPWPATGRREDRLGDGEGRGNRTRSYPIGFQQTKFSGTGIHTGHNGGD